MAGFDTATVTAQGLNDRQTRRTRGGDFHWPHVGTFRGHHRGLSHGQGQFLAAAQRVLNGDTSTRAANQLEGVVLEEYAADERFEELGEALAMYAPGQGSPYATADELRTIVQQTIAKIAHGT